MGDMPFERVDTPEKRSEYLAGWLDALCLELGPRPPGSGGERRAGDLLEREMGDVLGSVQREWFQLMGWEPISEPRLAVDGQELETYLYWGSPSTPDGGLVGRLVGLDSGGQVFGLMVGELPGPAAYLHASSYGPAMASLARPMGGKPTFGVGRQDLPKLGEAVERGSSVAASGGARFVPGAWSSNVVGTIPGRDRKEIVFCAHYDSQYNTPGANDNAASVIAMLLLARAVAHCEPELGVTFVATGAEEVGCHGAWHHVQRRQWAGTSDRVLYCINFDSLTYGPNLHFQATGQEFSDVLQEVHLKLGQETEPVFRVTRTPTLDEEPFYRAGAQAVHVNSRGYEETLPLWHRPEDLPGRVHPHLVENSFLFFREVLRRLAGV